MARIPDDMWDVISETELKYRGRVLSAVDKTMIEEKAEFTPFDGGCFLSNGPEFDLFVLPERRGKWKIRGTINEFVSNLVKKYGYAKVEISMRNPASLRLALGFGFKPVWIGEDMVKLEVRKWAVL